MVVEPRARAPRRARARPPGGIVAVEFALLLALFIGVVYVLAETAHAMYLAVTVQDATRRAARAAAAADFSDAAAMLALRQGVLPAGAGGTLLLGAPIDATYLRVDYLSLDAAGVMTPIDAGALPSCPVRNRAACAGNPHGAGCIRFVRARLCQPGTDCTAVAYPTLIPLPAALGAFIPQGLTLGRAATVVPAEALGYDPTQSCP